MSEPIVPGFEFVSSHYEIYVTPAGGQTETVVLETVFPSKIKRGWAVGNTMTVEVLKAEARGTSPTYGDIVLRAGSEFGIKPTTGMITNIVQDENSPGFLVGSPQSVVSGDVYFDVYYEIDLIDMGVTITNAPLSKFGLPGHPEHTTTVITSIPPTSGVLFIGQPGEYALRDKATGVTKATAGACANLVLDQDQLTAPPTSMNLYQNATAMRNNKRGTAVAVGDQRHKDPDSATKP